MTDEYRETLKQLVRLIYSAARAEDKRSVNDARDQRKETVEAHRGVRALR